MNKSFSVPHTPLYFRFELFVILSMIMTIVVPQFPTPALAAGTNCVTSTSPSGTYTVTPCFTSPSDGASVTGLQTVSANYTTTGANPGVAKVIFYLDGEYLLTDVQIPYSFTLPTNRWADGSHVLAVAALMKDGFTSQLSSITFTSTNGVTTPPVNTNTFTPTSGTTPQSGQPFVLAAVGDGASGMTTAGNVTDLMASWNPNLFLYLGDVYQKGTSTEFYNWYGTPSTFYGRFRSVTNPIIGNHEYEHGVAPGYFDYWDNVPNYYSYDAAGWHFIALNSNCGLLQDCALGTPQYQWLLNDLNTHNNICTIAYFHHPVYNVGPEGYTTTMNDMWALMASKGVDIVLTGHDHDYQRWVPLDGNGVPSSTGITEFVAGGGGLGIQNFIVNDSRMAVGYDTSPYSFGALRFQLNQNGAGFQYINTQGIVLDSGAIPCSGAPADTTAPSTPANLSATTHSATQVDLSWNNSTDDVGVAGYDIYRDGNLITRLGYITNYSDTGLTLGANYTYQVKARDAANNTSDFSNSASATTPSVLFSDGFESGNFLAWTSATNIVVTAQEHYAGAYAAHAVSNGTAGSYASKTLSTTYADLYYSVRFKIISKSSSTSAYVQRFRTAIDGPIGGVLISSTNKLGYKNDVAGPSNTTGPTVTLGVWHEVQTHLHINGTSSLIEIWYDGVKVNALTSTENFGTTPIGRINVGDRQAADIYDVALDEVKFNTSFIDTTDAISPSTPTGLTANATAPNSINVTWTAATDNISVTGYDLYRNGALVAVLGAVTNYTDTPVSPNFTYQYQVRARDAAGNVSGLSATASVTTPADTTAPTVSLTAPTDGITVNANVIMSADATDNIDISHVDFLVNGAVVGTADVEGGPYGIVWNSATVPDGSVTITARAVDTSSNETISSSRTITVDNASGDTTPPSTPTNFTATAAGSSRVDLTWTASTDNVGVTGYDVYRDGALLAKVGTVTTFSDSSVLQGVTYQYQVQARDAAGNLSGLTSAASVTVPAVLFKDGFESGDLSQWTNSGLTVQQQTVLEGIYAVHGANNGTSAAYAYRQLGTSQNDLYYSTWFRVSSQGANSAYVQRFRTSTNGAILGVFISNTGKLAYRNDVASATTTSSTSVSQGVWHQIQTHVHVNGANSLVEVWLDGVQISALSKIESLGSTPIGRIQLGDSSASDIYDAAFDEVAFDTSFIQSSNLLNTLIDSGPLGMVNSNSASFGFSSTTAGVTFECSLDAAVFSSCTSPQSLTGLPEGAHTFAVRAMDSLNNADQTPASRTWTVDTIAPTIPTVSPLDAAIDLPITTNSTVAFSEAMNGATVTTSNFTLVLQSDGTLIPASVTYDNPTNTATLQPSSPLANSTTYVARVKGGAGGVTDMAGNSLAADMVWSFTTVSPDTIIPSVTLTSPLDASTVSGTVTLLADATDNTAIDHVDFLVNGMVVGTATSAPYFFNWNSTSLPNGPAALSAQAVDVYANSATSSTNTVTIANDITPPSVPSNLAVNSPNGGQVDLSWAAAADNVGVIGYDILRNGTSLATVGAVTNYSDMTVSPSTPYQYQVQARDAAGNVSGFSTGASVTTSAPLFSDRFESGNLSNWTLVSGLTVQQQQVYAGSYAARATVSGTIADAFKDFSTPQYDLYYNIHFKILSQDPTNSVYVMRFRKADTLSALGIFVSPTGKLGYRNDIAGVSNTSTASVTLNAWHEVQAHIHVDNAGGTGLVEVWLDGTRVQSQAEALGNAPITRIQLGDSTTGRTYDIAFDDVSAATFHINPGDIQAPSTPANLNASAISASQVDLIWGAATDNVGVVGYEIYRNGTWLASTGAATTYSDTTTAPLTTYQYTVSARDAAANISAASSPALVTTPQDATPPNAMITAPVNGATVGNGTITLAAAATDNYQVAHVDFLVNGNMVGTDASSPYSVSWNSTALPDGAATLTARAVDTANNIGTSAEVVVTIDNTPPDTTITAKPLNPTNGTTANFSFTGSEANTTFGCSLDGAAYGTCTSPISYSTLTNGSHTFHVRALDAAGNTDPSPAAWTWTVDTVAPTVTSIIPANRSINISPTTPIVATFGEAIDPATITTATFTVKPKGINTAVAATVTYDPLTFKATLQPFAALASQTTYNVAITGGTNGVKDLAGNLLGSNFTSSFTTGTLDLTPPTVSLTAPANGAKVKGTVMLSATASDNVAVASVAFLVNGSVVGTDTTSPYNLSWNSATLADGSTTIAARATDTANLITTTSNITVTIDNTPPNTTITSGPSGTVGSTSASFSFTATETATFACSLDGAAFTVCSSPANYTGLAAGAHTFQVRATDTAGNIDATPASQSWTVLAPPDTTITAGPTGSVSSTSASFSFTSTISGSTFTCSLDGAAFTTCASPKTYSGLAAGSHTFQVAATSQGTTDPTPASRTWTIDLTAPTSVAITSPANGASITGQVTISATASDNVGVVSVSFYVDGVLLATDTSSPYSTTWNTNKVTQTTHSLYVRAVDAAGNVTQSATITVTVR